MKQWRTRNDNRQEITPCCVMAVSDLYNFQREGFFFLFYISSYPSLWEYFGNRPRENFYTHRERKSQPSPASNRTMLIGDVTRSTCHHADLDWMSSFAAVKAFSILKLQLYRSKLWFLETCYLAGQTTSIECRRSPM